MYAIALACEIRLQWYLKAKKQCDQVNSVKDLFCFVEKKSIISYFQIAYALQCDISKKLNLKSLHFYSSPVLLYLNFGFCFNDLKLLNILLSNQTCANPSKRLLNFDECLRMLEIQNSQNSGPDEAMIQSLLVSFEYGSWMYCLQNLGENLLHKGCFDDAIECFQKPFQIIEPLLENKRQQFDQLTKIERENLEKLFLFVSINFRKIGVSFIYLNKYEEAEKNLKTSREYLYSYKDLFKADIEREDAVGLRQHGLCLTRMNKCNEAKKFLDDSVHKLEHSSSYDDDCDYELSETFHELGCCLTRMNKHDKAKSCFEKEIDIKELLSTDVESDHDLSVALHELGGCLIKMDEHDKAKKCLERSLQIKELISPDFDFDLHVAITLHAFGFCLINLQDLDKAKPCLEESLQIVKRISSDESSDQNVANALHGLGCCLRKMGKFAEAISCLNSSLQISKKTGFDYGISDTLYELDLCDRDGQSLKN